MTITSSAQKPEYASLRIPLETTNCSFCSTCVNFLTEMSKKVGRTRREF